MKYTHNQAVALIIKYANDRGMLDTLEDIQETNKWLKSVLPNNSHKTKENDSNSK